MKKCTKCKEFKSYNDFGKDKSSKDGYQYWCKDCQIVYRKTNKYKIKKYRKDNKNTIRKQRKKYRKKNKYKIAKKEKEWRESNKDYLKDYYRSYNNNYRKLNKKKLKKYKEEYRKNNRDKLNDDQKMYVSLFSFYNTYAHQIEFCEEIRKDPNNVELLQVRCTESSCRKWFNPTNREVRGRVLVLNGNSVGELRFYCSDDCRIKCVLYNQKKYPKDNKPYYFRDSQSEWAELVKERDNHMCQRCGNMFDLVAHHIEGLNVNPIESADIDMGITLCKTCHKLAHKDKGCRYSDLKKENLCKNSL